MKTARCEACKNEYKNTMEVIVSGRSHWFDCFECAIHALAPICATCGTRVIGHGVAGASPAGEAIFCGGHCARAAARKLDFRADTDESNRRSYAV